MSVTAMVTASALAMFGQAVQVQTGRLFSPGANNRFDATMGRSAAVQVIAVTRSGTNRYAGSVRGNFRHSNFNAEDPVLKFFVVGITAYGMSTFEGPMMSLKNVNVVL